ncbi:MAG TPA: PEP-CTERM sorting domain-containing protein [Zeimonas sp.]|nr:PEP-CTERM sorting domain-containing protein [Zeimonas sp.]
MRIWIASILSLASVAAHAGTVIPVPEPGTLGLLAAAAVAGIAFGRKRRK